MADREFRTDIPATDPSVAADRTNDQLGEHSDAQEREAQRAIQSQLDAAGIGHDDNDVGGDLGTPPPDGAHPDDLNHEREYVQPRREPQRPAEQTYEPGRAGQYAQADGDPVDQLDDVSRLIGESMGYTREQLSQLVKDRGVDAATADLARFIPQQQGNDPLLDYIDSGQLPGAPQPNMGQPGQPQQMPWNPYQPAPAAPSGPQQPVAGPQPSQAPLPGSDLLFTDEQITKMRDEYGNDMVDEIVAPMQKAMKFLIERTGGQPGQPGPAQPQTPEQQYQAARQQIDAVMQGLASQGFDDVVGTHPLARTPQQRRSIDAIVNKAIARQAEAAQAGYRLTDDNALRLATAEVAQALRSKQPNRQAVDPRQAIVSRHARTRIAPRSAGRRQLTPEQEAMAAIADVHRQHNVPLPSE